MKLFSWLLPRKAPTLSLAQQQRLLCLPESAGLGDHPLRAQRWVVVDLETSGLNLNRDQVLSITPHLIRNLVRPAASASEFGAGTEASFRRRPDLAARPNAVLPGGRTSPGGAVGHRGHAIAAHLFRARQSRRSRQPHARTARRCAR